MVEWLEIFLSITPWIAWFFLGIGLPWALVLLPRHDWGDTALVLAVGLAMGPVWGTLWLFALGTFGEFTFAGALAGTIGITAIGAGWAFQRYRSIKPDPQSTIQNPNPPFRALQLALAIMLGIGMFANIWDTAFWPFLRYDTLWTFGYNPKIFMLNGHIPSQIDYYPQLVPLTFTFGNLVYGTASDYAARAAVPWFIFSSVMATYTLGWRLYGRHLVGMLAAALWLLTPAVLVWSSSGDLEHPMAIYFSLATLFLVLSWRELNTSTAQRYAVLAGLMLGAAMWTKPTAGAFVFGMGVLALGQTLYSVVQRDWEKWRKRFWLLVVVGLVAAPIGGVWYIRNILVGHPWTNLPADYWPDLAQRSGMQLNWLLYVGLLAACYSAWFAWSKTAWLRMGAALLAAACLCFGVLPTMLSLPAEGFSRMFVWNALNGFREPERALNASEVVALVAGGGLLLWSGWPAWQQIHRSQRQAFLFSWALGLPFFVVYFWSFSYHYRLALTVLPVIAAALAALLVTLLVPFAMKHWARRWATVSIAVLLCLPAPVATLYHTGLNTFNNTGINTTREKYKYANPALLNLVEFLEFYTTTNNIEYLRILAPGENRLAFFFPEWEIDDESLPTDIQDLHGYDIFINYVADFLWREAGLTPNLVQTWTEVAPVYPLGPPGQALALDGPAQLPKPRFLRPIMTPIDDGVSRYEIFAVDTQAPYAYVEPETRLDAVVFGDTMQLLGYDLPSTTLTPGTTYTLKFYWRGTFQAPPPGDYSIYLHLIAPGDPTQIYSQADGGLLFGLYPTRFLVPSLIFQDRREWTLPADLQPGRYQLRIGVYDPQTFVRLPLTVGGEAAGDGWTFTKTIEVLSANE